MNASSGVVASVNGTNVVVVAKVFWEFLVATSSSFVADGFIALIWREGGLAVNVGPNAGTVSGTVFVGANVVIVAAGSVSDLAFSDSGTSGLLCGGAKSGGRYATSVEASRILGRCARDGIVHDASSGGSGSCVVVANVSVTFVASCSGGARNRGRGTANLSRRNGVIGARRRSVASIWGLAFSASAETTACSTRILVFVARTSNQFYVDSGKFSEVVTAENVILGISGSEDELIDGNVTIASDSDGVEGNFAFSSRFSIDVVSGGL